MAAQTETATRRTVLHVVVGAPNPRKLHDVAEAAATAPARGSSQAEKLTPERRREIAVGAAAARNKK